jgi:L-iditol 2-dehydrogenase
MGDRAAAGSWAVACAAGGGTVLERRGAPRPGPGELLLALRVSGLCGTDLFKLAARSAPPGAVLGHEVVGEVVALGSGDLPFAPGDRVVVPHHVSCGACEYCSKGSETQCREFRRDLLDPGGFAERILVRAEAARRAARKLPAGLDDEAAVFMEPAACVLRGVRRAGLLEARTGARTVAAVQGAGSMGLLHLLVLGALVPGCRVLVVDPMPERRRLALELGAAAAAAPADEARRAAAELSGGTGADAVFDTAGGAGPLRSALDLCRAGGTAILFAHAPGAERADFDLNALFKGEKRVIGSYSGALAEQAEVFAALADGRLDPRPLVTHRMPLDRFDEAVALCRERQALKVLLTPVEAAP